MAAVPLTATELRELIAEKGITADRIPTYGLRFVWRGRDILVGLIRAGDRAGEIVGFDITLYENGRRVSPSSAYWLHMQEELVRWLAWPFYEFGKWASAHRIDDKVIAAVVIAAVIWTVGSLKNILR